MSLLPKEKTLKSKKLEDYSILLYGPPKIGKSTFASRFDKLLFLATDPGLKHLDVYQTPIPNWVTFKSVVKELQKKPNKFNNIAIDTVDILYKHCSNYVCSKFNFEHPSDEEWGKGYELIQNEFAKWVLKLTYLPGGIIFISHSQDKDVRTRVQRINKIMPTIPGSCRKIIIPLVDIIAYCGFDVTGEDSDRKEKRVIIVEPSESLEAGDRTGRLPKKLPLSYKAFRRYFDGNNRLGKKNK